MIMKKSKNLFLAFIVGTAFTFSFTSCQHDSTYTVCYKTEIEPIIQSNCAMSGCHDAATAEEDIVLDSYENILKIVKPGKPNSSELYEVLTSGGEKAMPPSPKAPLNSEVVASIRLWILQGAKNDPTCQ